jgi:hypothetical protein
MRPGVESDCGRQIAIPITVQFPDYVISGLSDRRQSAPIPSTENELNDITSNTQRQSKKSTTDSKDAATDQQQCRPPADINVGTRSATLLTIPRH